MSQIQNLWPFNRKPREIKNITPPSEPTVPPGGRSSKPTFSTSSVYTDIKGKMSFINPAFRSDLIPVIRKLSWVNPDMGNTLNDMVQLTNTGHRIKFDPGVPAEQIDKMRLHIANKQTTWGDGVDGMNGLINKMISQIWIAGALSNEWVVDNNKLGISNVVLVNPETIVFNWNRRYQRFFPYQRQNSETGQVIGERMVKLNTNTYKYFALNGDTEIPYGIPPFLTALNALSTQTDMDQNIRFIMKQLGLLGFFETLMEKPDAKDGESDDAYRSRLVKLLTDSKTNIMEGIGDGVVVGFKGDHEFKFNSTTKNLSGVSDIYNQNEIQVANGLKTSGNFLGVGKTGAETGINIIFTKMLSQLQNVQKIVAANLKFGYTLELRLAGFKFDNLRIEFEPSTITDELKYQQAQEYKIRNISNKFNMGIISQEQAADELGYDKPDQTEPRQPLDDSGQVKKEREDDKDKSDRKTRDKNKPQPKRKDQKSQSAEAFIDAFLDYFHEHNSHDNN